MTQPHSEVGQSHRTLHDAVAERIRKAILDGTLNPGERLVEDRLAQEFDVSRHPVREALRTLQLEGFVDISPRRGATVSRVSTEEAGELFEVLAALDGLAARLAASSRGVPATREAEAIMQEAAGILDTKSGYLSPNDLADLASLNREFHSLIVSASANRQLIDTITPLRDRIHWIQTAVNRRRPELSWAEHRSLLDAITAGDPETSERVARAHIEAARAMYLSQRRPDSAGRL